MRWHPNELAVPQPGPHPALPHRAVIPSRGLPAGPQYVSLFACVLYLCFGGWAYWDALYTHPDPQGGLVFLVIPVAGAIGASILLGVLLALRGRMRSRWQSGGDGERQRRR